MWEIDNRSSLPRCLEGLAQVAIAEGDAEHAVLLLGSAAALRESLEMPIPITEQNWYDEVIQVVRGMVENELYKARWQEGKTRPLEQIVAFVLTL